MPHASFHVFLYLSYDCVCILIHNMCHKCQKSNPHRKVLFTFDTLSTWLFLVEGGGRDLLPGGIHVVSLSSTRGQRSLSVCALQGSLDCGVEHPPPPLLSNTELRASLEKTCYLRGGGLAVTYEAQTSKQSVDLIPY